jgi:hypothetical protein
MIELLEVPRAPACAPNDCWRITALLSAVLAAVARAPIALSLTFSACARASTAFSSTALAASKAITHLRLVVEYYAITPTKTTYCRMYCDSKGALARIGDKHHDGFSTTRRRRPHYDLKVAIRTCLLQLSIPIS